MPDNQSPDDIFRYLMKMMEELAGEMGADKSPHFVGYTIVRTPGEAPRVVRITSRSPCELPYELVDGPAQYYITIELPIDLDGAPMVDIDRRRVVVHVGGYEMAIDLPEPVDPTRCSFELRRGLLDIVCQKV
jgi:HSP20 family molecular chaperone IbpA